MAWRSGQSYSADLRERVLAALDGGLPAALVAEQFGVSVSFIDKALKRRRLTGESTARAQCNQQALKLAAHHEAIRAEVERRPDVTLEDLRGWLVEDPWRRGEPRADAQHSDPAGPDAKEKDRTGAMRGRGVPAAPLGGAGSTRHRRAAHRLARRARRDEPGPIDLHRRDRGIDQAGPALRPLPPRRTARCGPPALRGLLAAFPSGIG